MLLTIAVVLFILWLLGFIVFHVTVGLIHLLLLAGIVVVVAHLLTPARSSS
jgi:hypothetical protein